MSLNKATWTIGIDGGLAPDAGRSEDHPRVNGRPRLGLWFEGRSERLGKRLGMNLEAQTGDEDFDRRVYIHSHAPIPIVEKTMASPESRAAVLGILDAGWSKLVIDGRGGRLGVRKSAKVGREGTFFADLDLAIGNMVRLARSLPRFDGDKYWRTRVVDVAAPIAGFATLVSGALLAVWGAHDYPLEDSTHAFEAAGYGLALWPVVALLVFLLARRGAEGLGTWATCMFSMLIGLPLLGAGTMLIANGRYDHGAEVVHTVEIVGKDARRGSKKTRYYVQTRDYRTPPLQEKVEMQVDRDIFDSAHVGGGMHLVFKPGRLGYRWLHSFEVVPPE
jgi:hypothetical protein